MSDPRPRSLSFLVELIVITASILLAFSLEAWWAERVDRSRFDEIVVAVRAVFAGSREELERAREIHEATAERLETLVSMMGPNPEAAALDALHPLWAEVRFTSADVPLGVLSNLLASGDISSFPDLDFRARLIGWPAAIEDHVATESMYDRALEDLRRSVSTRSPVPPVWGSPDYDTAFPIQARAVLTSFAVENDLARSLHLLRIVIRENRQLRERLESLLADLDALIERR